MALTLDDIMAAPTDLDELKQHLIARGIVPPPAPVVSAGIPAIGGPAGMPLSQPDASGWRHPIHIGEEVAASGHPTVPKATIGDMTPPEIGSPAVPAPSAMTVAPMQPPKLGFKEQMALPESSPGVRPGSSAYYEGQLEKQDLAKANPWGTAENHPGIIGKIGHVAGRIGNIAGDILAPGVTAMIPGSDLNKEFQRREAEHNLGEAETRESKLASETESRKNVESEIAQRTGTAVKKVNSDAQGNVVSWEDAKGIHAMDDPNTPQSVRDIAEASAGKNVPEADQPIPNVEAINKQLTDRYQVLNPGKPLPDEYKVPDKATKGDYNRIEKALAAKENATATEANRAQVLELRRQTALLAQTKQTTQDAAIEGAAQSLAKMDINDLTPLKDIASLRGDERLRIYQRAKEINPKFNTSEVTRKVKMMDDYVNGADAKQLQSFGTFLEHAGAAADLNGEVGRSNTKVFNKPLTWWKENVQSDPRYTAYMAALEPVRKEFEGFLLGGKALYGDDRAAAEKILDDKSTPAQISDALKQMGHTVQARYNEIDHRFKNQMGTSIANAIGDLSDEAKTGAEKIGVKVGSTEGLAPGAPTAKTYAQADIDAAVAAHPGLTAAQAKAAFDKKGWKPGQ